jgi:hypothetical protein
MAMDIAGVDWLGSFWVHPGWLGFTYHSPIIRLYFWRDKVMGRKNLARMFWMFGLCG